MAERTITHGHTDDVHEPCLVDGCTRPPMWVIEQTSMSTREKFIRELTWAAFSVACLAAALWFARDEGWENGTFIAPFLVAIALWAWGRYSRLSA